MSYQHLELTQHEYDTLKSLSLSEGVHVRIETEPDRIAELDRLVEAGLLRHKKTGDEVKIERPFKAYVPTENAIRLMWNLDSEKVN